MSQCLRYLQGWIGIVGLMALGNTLSCFRSWEFLADKLYTGAPEEVNGLMARLFGVWTLLAAILRLYCAYDIRNMGIYNMTYISFILALGHFLSECYVYGSAPFTIGVAAPLFVSGSSLMWMTIGYLHLRRERNAVDDELSKYKSRKDINRHLYSAKKAS